MKRILLLAFLILASQGIVYSAPAPLPSSSPTSISKDVSVIDCAGFKRLSLQTIPGFCSGLVASRLGFARGVAVIGNEIWVADMGGWRTKHGRLLRIKNLGNGPTEVISSGLDEPNALAALPNGMLLLASAGRIDKFDPKNAAPGHIKLIPVLTGLPATGRHPVPSFVAAADGTLYVNVGSATDHCEGPDNTAPNPTAACPETLEVPPRGSIIVSRWDNDSASDISADHVRVYARGLRNSMALALDGSSRLWAATNARDFIHLADPSLPDEKLPPDTLAQIKKGEDFGWPQCYGFRESSPEYKDFPCASKAAPDLLLPAHAAPLGMIFIGDGIPLGRLKNGLLIGYHGYRKTGHRIVWVQLSDHGPADSQPLDVLWGWENSVSLGAIKLKQNAAFSASGLPMKQGSPVAMARLPNGGVLITDDHNGTLVVLAPDGESR